MATSYKNMVNMLHKKYPGKHIEVGPNYLYYDHDGGYFKTEYSFYIEDGENMLDIPTFAELEEIVRDLCEKEA